MDIYKELSKDILKLFFYNRNVYGKQIINFEGEIVYNTIYSDIDANKIKYMIANKGSIMTYQQDFNKLKWICLDFDIKSAFLDKEYDFDKDEIYKNKLIEDVSILIEYLEGKNISFLMEYSGNRGVHIWIFLDRDINKELGYDIVNTIYNNVGFKYVNKPNEPIAVDLFPKTRDSRNNKIGLGVKIPISYHLKSRRYSYCIEGLNELKGISEIDRDFIYNQKRLLNNIKRNEVKLLIKNLDIKNIEEEEKYECYTATIKSSIEFEQTIEQLRRCSIYDYIFNKPHSELGEFDRLILVGTLIRLETEEDKDYGRNLLLYYFSQDKKKFDNEKTLGKLEMLSNLYPPNINYIEKKYNMKCGYCENNNIKNSIELLDNIIINKSDKNHNRVNWVISSEKKYLALNDEIPLNFIYDELDNLSTEEILNEINNIKSGNYRNTKFYKYNRQEDDKKNRILYSLSAIDRVLTTFTMHEIDKILYGTYSSSSYSYRINYNMKKTDIFINWNKLWFKYVKAVENKILSNSYDNYYIIKLDLHKYYENISIEQLRELLYLKPDSLSEYIITNFNEGNLKEYQNMCEYLLNVCLEINNKGVPQGPAFARYLAEIYLLQIDEFIQAQLLDEYEFYFRYVDDMIILVESKEKAEYLYRQISEKLGELGLTVNNKSLLGKVEDYKYEIIGSDIRKYFIDGIDESTPERVKSKAIEMVNKMLLNSDSSLNIKEIPFFLTHLIDKNYIDIKKDEIIEKIIETNLGRGSLFKHFYKNILFKYYEEDKKYYKNLQGLSRGNFINELSFNIHELSKRHIEEIIDYYLKNNQLYDYEYNELHRIILLSGIDYDIDLTQTDIFESFVNIVITTNDIIWNENLLRKFLIGLQRYDDTSKVIKCIDSILKNSKELKNRELLVDTMYAITRYKENKFSGKDVQFIYNVTIYMTLYIDKKEKLVDIWVRLINLYNQNDDLIKYNDWFKYHRNIDKNEIQDHIIVHFLTCAFSESGMIEQKGVTSIEKECAAYMIVYLFGDDKRKISLNSYKDIRDILEEKKLKFLLWCLNDNVQYFPSKEISIKNTYLNNRIVLKIDDKIIIRGYSNIFSEVTKDVNGNVKLEEEQWYNDKNYSYVTIDLDDKLVDISQKLNGLDYFEAIEFITKINASSLRSGRRINVFEKGTFTEGRDKIYLSFSKYDDYIVLDENNYVENSNINFIELLIDKLCDSKVQQKKYTNRIYDIKNFKKDFIPSLIKNPEDKMKYIEILNEKINENKKKFCDDIYYIELSKIQAIMKYIKKVKVTKYSKEIQALNYYNSLYNNELDNFILYGKIDIEEDNIHSILKTLNKSISSNLDNDEIKSISSYIESEEQKIVEILDLKNSELLKEFKKVEITKNLKDNSYIRINREDIKINECKIYDLLTIDGIRQLNEMDIFYLINNKNTYYSNNVIIVIPDLITRIFEIIENKSNINDKSSYKINVSIKNCNGYDKAIENIMCQAEVGKSDAIKKIGDFFNGVDSKYYEVILKIIGSHRCILEEEMEQFTNNILKYTEKVNSCILPLKKKIDDNGMHQIIFTKYKDKFDRGSISKHKIENDYKMINKKEKIENLVIITDISISGSQFTKTINNILNNNTKDNMKQDINGEAFKSLLLEKPKITIINCIYTDIFKEKILNYMTDYGYQSNEINFEGTEIKYTDFLYINCVNEKKERDKFIEYINKYHKSFKNEMTFVNFQDYIKNIEKDDTRNVLVARYKSMPKYHMFIFTQKNSIFKYRVDK